MGMLNPWALRYNNWKKQIALRLFQKKDLRHSNAFHAASDLEADSIRAFGLKQPISIIPHDVHITPDQAHFCSENYRIALFLGRLHPVKNLMSLIHAWAMVKPKGWKLRLVGPDEVNHRKALERLTAKLGASDCIEISGPVYGSEKVALLADAQLSFLVSKSENFGISAAESLAAGVPVIASRSVPWSCLKEERMGWWVEGEVEALAAAIAEATSLSESELQAMGIIGRAYAKKHFCWEAISIRFAEFYDQLVKSCKK
jgi:glycosyltransferase involved in cell wall biosynthesis